MKKYALSCIVLLLIGSGAVAQTYSEDFEGYSRSEKLAAKSPHWRVFGNAYDATSDPSISKEFAHSGKKSLFMHSNSNKAADLVLDFGGTHYSGSYTLEFWVYIPKESEVYVGLEGAAGDGEIVESNLILKNDSAQLFHNNEEYYTPFKTQKWQKLEFLVDLTKNIWTAEVNDKKLATYRLLDTTNQLSGINFYGNTVGSVFWIDDVSYTYTPHKYSNKNLSITAASTSGQRLVGSFFHTEVGIQNQSNETVQSIELQGTHGQSINTAAFTDLDMAPGQTFYFEIADSFVVEAGVKSTTLKITEFNGNETDDAPEDNEIQLAIESVTPALGKRVLIEEGTGTWCGWCPRGAVTLERMKSNYSEYAIGVAVHVGDVMGTENYSGEMGSQYFSSVPSAQINRAHKSDMFYTLTEDLFYQEIVKVPSATMAMAAQQNGNELKVSVDYSFLAEVPQDWRVVCLLVEDQVTGTTSKYIQTNFYAGGNNGPMGGYENLPDYIDAADMVYNHVARSVSPSSFGTSIFDQAQAPNSSLKATFSYTLKSDWNTENMSVVPMLIRSDSTIDNSAIMTLNEALGRPFEEGISVGLEPVSISTEFDIFPNPSEDYVHLNFPESMEAGQLEIFNMRGQLMQTTSINSGTWEVNVSTFEKGLYTILVSSKGNRYRQQLIVQ